MVFPRNSSLISFWDDLGETFYGDDAARELVVFMIHPQDEFIVQCVVYIGASQVATGICERFSIKTQDCFKLVFEEPFNGSFFGGESDVREILAKAFQFQPRDPLLRGNRETRKGISRIEFGRVDALS